MQKCMLCKTKMIEVRKKGVVWDCPNCSYQILREYANDESVERVKNTNKSGDEE